MADKPEGTDPLPDRTSDATVADTAPGSDPSVTVKNIGLHIGGGPNDAVTKGPILRSVEPHFQSIARCWKHAEPGSKGGDFGVDLRIPASGGQAEVTHPRTAVRGQGFEECVVGVLEQIEFEKPKRGATVASYSVRFTTAPTSSAQR